VKLKRDVAAGATVSWADVDYDASSQAVQVRREMEMTFGHAEERRKEIVATTDEHG
jgi:predicted homoserine dehydrogenase-like protein